MAEDLGYWLLASEYSVDEASLLLAGVDPFLVRGQIINARCKLDSNKIVMYEAGLNAACESGFISYTYFYEASDEVKKRYYEEYCTEEYGIDAEYDHILTKEDVLKFAAQNGLEFPLGHPVPQSLCEKATEDKLAEIKMAPDHPNFSENLAVANMVWTELNAMPSSEDINKRPRKEAEDLLKKRYPHWSNRRVKAIAQVVNWTENSETGTVLSPVLPVTLKKNKAANDA